MAEAHRPSTFHRPGGPIVNLVETTSFQALMVIKDEQTYWDAHFVTKLFHMQGFFYKSSTLRSYFSSNVGGNISQLSPYAPIGLIHRPKAK